MGCTGGALLFRQTSLSDKVQLAAGLELAFVFEGLGPIFDQAVEGFLGSALACDHVVVHARLHRQQ
jgi:hypothetical protein